MPLSESNRLLILSAFNVYKLIIDCSSTWKEVTNGYRGIEWHSVTKPAKSYSFNEVSASITQTNITSSYWLFLWC